MALTPKQEKFAQKYVETGNASEAYRQSYSHLNMKTETVNRNAKALMDTNKILTRVAELQREAQKRHEVTVDSLTVEYEQARQLASENAQPSAMVSATTGKAKLHGLVEDRHRVEGNLSIAEQIAAVINTESGAD